MPLDVGAALPELGLRTRSGAVATTGKPTVFTFFKSTCPSCALTLPYLDALDRAFDAGTVNVWGVSQENLTVADEFTGRCSTNIAVLDDSALDASRALDVQNVPTTFLVDAGGTIRDVLVGHDKAALNRLAQTVAEWSGNGAPVIAPDDDGIPAFQPG